MKMLDHWSGRLLSLACTTMLTFAFTGCDVDIEDSGELPTMEVQDGEMPEVDVRGPDVDVGTEEEEVTVPDVDIGTEEESVTVPSVDVDLPDENEG